METAKIPIGFRFVPSNEELIGLLERKVKGVEVHHPDIYDCDLYGEYEPWMIFDSSLEKTFFTFTKLKRKNQSRIDRTAGCGTWKEQNSNKIKDSTGRVIWIEKSFVFEEKMKDGNSNLHGHWIMHEYALPHATKLDEIVLCRIRCKDSDKKRKAMIVHQNQAGAADRNVYSLPDEEANKRSRADQTINTNAMFGGRLMEMQPPIMTASKSIVAAPKAMSFVHADQVSQPNTMLSFSEAAQCSQPNTMLTGALDATTEGAINAMFLRSQQPSESQQEPSHVMSNIMPSTCSPEFIFSETFLGYNPKVALPSIPLKDPLLDYDLEVALESIPLKEPLLDYDPEVVPESVPQDFIFSEPLLGYDPEVVLESTVPQDFIFSELLLGHDPEVALESVPLKDSLLDYDPDVAPESVPQDFIFLEPFLGYDLEVALESTPLKDIIFSEPLFDCDLEAEAFLADVIQDPTE